MARVHDLEDMQTVFGRDEAGFTSQQTIRDINCASDPLVFPSFLALRLQYSFSPLSNVNSRCGPVPTLQMHHAIRSHYIQAIKFAFATR